MEFADPDKIIEGLRGPLIPVRIIDIVCGPKPEDWRVKWVYEFEVLAREFWDNVEGFNMHVPGSWVD